MDQNNNSKIMTVSFVTVAIIVSLIVGVMLDTLQGVSSFVVRMNSIDAFRHGLPVGSGILTFLFLQFNPKIKAWADECIVEVKKVVWPTRKDTVAMTTVVCVMLLIAGVILGVFDVVAGNVVSLILS